MIETVILRVTRADGVRFVYDKFSPNGTEINFLTAHNDIWASVAVDRFLTASDALQAVEAFVMPA
jgi:hypothetical protein